MFSRFAVASSLVVSLVLAACASDVEPTEDESASSEAALGATARQCATVRCAQGTHCAVKKGHATCVPDPQPAGCSTDADCHLVDNYCGGCQCLSLLSSQTGPTCSNPVNCFVEPCGGRTAVCNAGACVVQ